MPGRWPAMSGEYVTMRPNSARPELDALETAADHPWRLDRNVFSLVHVGGEQFLTKPVELSFTHLVSGLRVAQMFAQDGKIIAESDKVAFQSAQAF